MAYLKEAEKVIEREVNKAAKWTTRMKKVEKTFFKDNVPFKEGGGLTSLLVPKTLKPAAAVGALVGTTAIPIAVSTTAKNYKDVHAGEIAYQPLMERMTRKANSQFIESAKAASGGNPEVYKEMLGNMVKNEYIDRTSYLNDEMGINQRFVEAIYNMG